MSGVQRGALVFFASVLFAPALYPAEVASGTAPAVNFQRQVRPILSDNCFLCHGPDKGTRMADVRLDIREGAFAARKNGSIIVPGHPEQSLLVKRIFSENPGFRMPPVFSHKTLTPEQKQTLQRWIEQGAKWEQHWAFVAPVRPPLPATKNGSWAKNPIDRFVLAKLEANGLEPAEEADRHNLIRRVTLDLTGLPPTPKEVEAFVKDRSQDAYEKVVDRLLASPHYGEHRGRYWLDAARYADSQGLHIDNYREMWPYRDWVINAFNKNMPFSEFTIEQLAGDLLPNATLDQKIGSGFHRCNVTTNEGGSIPEEVAAMYAKDRADTTGTVWLGLTVGCATCHDHKFDPISQKDFYSLTSFFRNTTQNPLDGNVPDTPPTVIVPESADRQRWTELNSERASLREVLAKAESNASPSFEKWLQSAGFHSAAPPYDTSSRLLELVVNDGSQVIRSGQPEAVSLDNGVTIAEGIGGLGKALHFSPESSVKLPNVPEIDTDKPFTISTWVYVPKAKETLVIASQSGAGPGKETTTDAKKHRGWVIEMAAHSPSITLTGDDGKYLSARPAIDYALKPESWQHLTFTYDGSRQRAGLSLYVNGNFVPTYGTGEDIHPLESSIRTSSPLVLGGSERRYFPNGAIAEFVVLNDRVNEQTAKLLPLWRTVAGVATKEPSQLSDGERQTLLVYYANRIDPESRKTLAQLNSIDAERYVIARRGAVTFIMQERTDAQPIAHVLFRGQYDAQRDEVHPNVPSVLPPMSQSFPRNRLGLAEWMVDPSNPLVARVTVNRFWQQVFGTGIVKTAEDFGSQGDPPSHPELLDWLAVEFRDSGWDVKKFFRLMVTSATYRQSASADENKLQRDPDNRLLSRGPRFRMDGEMVRDYALAASGLLTPTIGGPSVKPYQPANIWETVAMDNSNTRFYKQDSGDNLYRRSLYTFWKRSAPPASMDIFNAPSRETCTVRRERTNTPLQALVTMNDPQLVEAARVLAQNALLSARSDVGKEMNYIASRLLSRSLDAKERAVVLDSYRDYLSYYDAKPQDAEKLLTVGESKADPRLPKPKLAAMTMVTNELMNLDEVLVK